MSLAEPVTKIWCCTRCGELWEMLPDERPAFGFDGLVLCDGCSDDPYGEVFVADDIPKEI